MSATMGDVSDFLLASNSKNHEEANQEAINGFQSVSES